MCGLVDELGQGLGCVRSLRKESHPDQSFLQVQSFQLQRGSQGFVLRRHATSTEGCSVGTKWWRTMTVIAS